jgi:hypothetical protein
MIEISLGTIALVGGGFYVVGIIVAFVLLYSLCNS